MLCKHLLDLYFHLILLHIFYQSSSCFAGSPHNLQTGKGDCSSTGNQTDLGGASIQVSRGCRQPLGVVHGRLERVAPRHLGQYSHLSPIIPS